MLGLVLVRALALQLKADRINSSLKVAQIVVLYSEGQFLDNLHFLGGRSGGCRIPVFSAWQAS
jgi:hypothetical protein